MTVTLKGNVPIHFSFYIYIRPLQPLTIATDQVITLQGEAFSGNYDLSMYARFYSFSLSGSAEVTIELTSATDPYLFLLKGGSKNGDEVARNGDIDWPDNHNSRITWTLTADTYNASRHLAAVNPSDRANIPTHAPSFAYTWIYAPGVIMHEFGHTAGLTDLYHLTGYSNYLMGPASNYNASSIPSTDKAYIRQVFSNHVPHSDS